MAEYLVSDPAVQDAHPHTQYDLVANICHEGEPAKGKVLCFPTYIKVNPYITKFGFIKPNNCITKILSNELIKLDSYRERFLNLSQWQFNLYQLV